jgi:hypothetical protein
MQYSFNGNFQNCNVIHLFIAEQQLASIWIINHLRKCFSRLFVQTKFAKLLNEADERRFLFFLQNIGKK